MMRQLLLVQWLVGIIVLLMLVIVYLANRLKGTEDAIRGTTGNQTVPEQSDDEKLEEMLDEQFKAGMLGRADRITILAQFRAQRKASTSAFYSAIAAVISAIFAAASWLSALLR